MAKEVRIVTDTISSLPKEEAEKLDIEQVPLEIVFGDKVYHDKVDLTADEFYSLLRQAEKLPTTSAPSPNVFLEAYRKVSRKAVDIFCITLSAKFSGTFNSAQLAVEMAREALPCIVIKVFDSTTAAAAEGLVVLAAAKAAYLGKSLREVADSALSVMQRVQLFVALDTLSYLVKGGRIPKIAGVAASLLKVKPILTIKDGEAHVVANARTSIGAINRILKMMEEKVVKEEPLHVAVMHADALDRAIILRDEIAARFKCTMLFITEFTPVMGVHTGPGVVGVAFYSGD